MGVKLRRDISGFFEVPYEQVCVNESNEFEDPEVCSCVCYDKAYIREVIYNEPATIVMWSDGTKTVAKAHGDDIYSRETGLSVCILKKFIGSSSVREIFEDWVDGGNRITISDVRQSLKLNKPHVIMEDVVIEPVKEDAKEENKKSIKRVVSKLTKKK